MTDEAKTTRCECWGGSTYGTEDPAVRLCDLCGGTVPTDPVTGEYEEAKPIRETTACGWGAECCGGDPRGCYQPGEVDRECERILSLTDEQVMAEALAEGVNIEAEAQWFRAVAEKAKQEVARRGKQ